MENISFHCRKNLNCKTDFKQAPSIVNKYIQNFKTSEQQIKHYCLLHLLAHETSRYMMMTMMMDIYMVYGSIYQIGQNEIFDLTK